MHPIIFPVYSHSLLNLTTSDAEKDTKLPHTTNTTAALTPLPLRALGPSLRELELRVERSVFAHVRDDKHVGLVGLSESVVCAVLIGEDDLRGEE